MFKFLKKKATPAESAAEDAPQLGWRQKLRQGLQRTRSSFKQGLQNALKGKVKIDASVFEALETALLVADVGMPTTQFLLEQLRIEVEKKRLEDPLALIQVLKTQLRHLLGPLEQPLLIDKAQPFVLLMVGVNGAGKTTSIAKLAHHFCQQDKSVMLAAGDTFRAAAIEQLTTWGQRHQVPVIAQKQGSDSASVIYDAIMSAKARQIDLLIADTAGRLHTQINLMNELKKIKRVMAKALPEAPHETMLVVDATMGQNALLQAMQFHESIGLDSIALTKLDGTAKGGMVFAIARQLGLPVRFIGVGEQADDLQLFNADAFIEALFESTTELEHA